MLSMIVVVPDGARGPAPRGASKDADGSRDPAGTLLFDAPATTAANFTLVTPSNLSERRRDAINAPSFVGSREASTPQAFQLRMGANMKYWIGWICAACALGLAGCNTMEGVGTDIARGGQKIQNTAQDVRQDWREASVRNEREYDEARATCAGLSGTDHDACIDRAHERYAAEMNTARRQYPRSSMAAESQEDRLEDAYDAARTRCESFRGDAEDQCIADARARYRQ